jgi:hypothetical protein
VTAGLVGSVAIPTGDLAAIARTGFGVTAVFQATGGFFGARGELAYTSLGGDRIVAGDGEVTAPDTRIISGTLDAVLGAGTLRNVVRPYFVAGVGLYRFQYDGSDARRTDSMLHDFSSRTEFGVNAGLAVRFPLGPFTALVESRLHTVFGDESLRYLAPIGVGITF